MKQFKLLLALVLFIFALALPARGADPPGMPVGDDVAFVQFADQTQPAVSVDVALVLATESYAEVIADKVGGRCSIATNFVRGDDYGLNRLGDKFALDGLRPLPAEATTLDAWEGGGRCIGQDLVVNTNGTLKLTNHEFGAEPLVLNRRI